jgi:hypothetical protein
MHSSGVHLKSRWSDEGYSFGSYFVLTYWHSTCSSRQKTSTPVSGENEIMQISTNRYGCLACQINVISYIRKNVRNVVGHWAVKREIELLIACTKCKNSDVIIRTSPSHAVTYKLPLFKRNLVFVKSRQFRDTVGPVKSVIHGNIGWKLGSPTRRPYVRSSKPEWRHKHTKSKLILHKYRKTLACKLVEGH